MGLSRVSHPRCLSLRLSLALDLREKSQVADLGLHSQSLSEGQPLPLKPGSCPATRGSPVSPRMSQKAHSQACPPPLSTLKDGKH